METSSGHDYTDPYHHDLVGTVNEDGSHRGYADNLYHGHHLVHDHLYNGLRFGDSLHSLRANTLVNESVAGSVDYRSPCCFPVGRLVVASRSPNLIVAFS